MFTFTSSKGGTYTKLRLINEIKTYVTYLIANSKAEIYFFSNIEIGHSFTNPHIHTQLWCNDLNALRAIYDKVISKFGLNKKRCKLSEPTKSNKQVHSFGARSWTSIKPLKWAVLKIGPLLWGSFLDQHKTPKMGGPKDWSTTLVHTQSEPQRSSISYNYVLKDYAESLDDERLWAVEQAKKRMRKQLGTKLRFYSRSKSRYSQKAYRYFYRYFGVLRGVADEFMDYFFSIFFKKERVFKTSISSFITIKNKGVMLPTLGSETYLECKDIGVLFYSPANDPPVICL